MARDYFQEALARFNNIQYPSATQRQFDNLRNDLRKDVLSTEFDNAREEYRQLLSGTGMQRKSIDATEGGEQQQIVINPNTGATEIITPEYNRMFREDKTDFNPGGQGAFENIYDAGLGLIDPRTGKVKDDEEVVEDTTAGLISDSGREREGRDKGTDSNITHEVINGISYRINKATGEVEKLEGIDAMIAKTLGAYVDNFTIGGLVNSNKSYNDKMKDLKNINEDAYNEVTKNVREQARNPYQAGYEDDSEQSFFDQAVNKVKNIFADPNKDGGNNTDGTTGGTNPGAGTDGTGGPDSNYGNNNNNNGDQGGTGSDGGESQDQGQQAGSGSRLGR